MQPEIKVAPNSFLLRIPKIVSKKEFDLIIDFLAVNKIATRLDIEKILKVRKTSAGAILKNMIDKGIIIKEGGSKNTIYKLK